MDLLGGSVDNLEHLTMKRLLAAFSFESIQTTITILDWLKSNGKTLEDIRLYVNTFKHKEPRESVSNGILDPSGKYVKKVIKPVVGCGSKKLGGYSMCPSCGHKTAKSFEVNTKPCNQIGGDYIKQVVCKNCNYEEFI